MAVPAGLNTVTAPSHAPIKAREHPARESPTISGAKEGA